MPKRDVLRKLDALFTDELRWPRKGEKRPCSLCQQAVKFLGRDKQGKGQWQYHLCSWPTMTYEERKAKGLYLG